jgi:hypothetical protein
MYSKGVTWIDDARIPFVDDGDKEESYRKPLDTIREGFVKTTKPEYKPQGRFPANILVCDDMLNDGVITQYNKNRTDNGTYLGGHRKEYVGTDDNDVVKQIKGQFFNDKGSNSRYYDIDKWFNNLIDG